MNYETLLYDVTDEIATITLNRPARLNAYSATMGREIVGAVREAEQDRAVRVLILTGAGDRAFCAGADLAGFASNIKEREHGNAAREERGGGMLAFPGMMQALSKPSIVAINGYALGVGATMTLPCDIRIASENAKIGFIFPRVGVAPELGSTFLLPRLIGAARAAEMFLTGRHYSAHDCLAMGLVSQVTASGDLIAKAHELANEIIQGSPTSLALTRRGLYLGLNSSLESAMEFELFALERCYASPEHKEYVTAFMEKRKPDLSRIKR
ncbi:MAG: enoyl-CoA hydratase/isomerase family protein [Candidatus Binataceae bacterium]